MSLLLGIIFLSMLIACPTFRRIAISPFKVVYNGIKDLLEWVFHCGWRRCKETGIIVAYTGIFGRGKTLSAVHKVRKLYKRYNDKRIYDKFRKKWVIQKIVIYSNVKLNDVPYVLFTGMQQMVDVAHNRARIDEINDTLTLSFFIGDEFSVQMNSRDFKSNFNPLLLNTVLTCRHHYIGLLFSCQRFSQTDALLRQVTSYVVDCGKSWRVIRNYRYDAWEMENATNVMLLKPYKRQTWFATDEDFESYDTLACVDNLVKECQEGRMISDKEILELQGYESVGVDGIVRPSRKLKKARKK